MWASLLSVPSVVGMLVAQLATAALWVRWTEERLGFI